MPTILVICYGFHLMFEAPFLKVRNVSALRQMPIIGPILPGPRAAAPHAPAAAEVIVASKAT